MKKSVVLIALLFVSFGVSAVAQSQNKPKYQVLFSNVMSLSKEKLVLTPMKKGGDPVAVVITKDTKFFADDGRTEIAQEQFKKGDEVTATCVNEQPLRAVRVRKGFHMEI